jgi:hypothetical protein
MCAAAGHPHAHKILCVGLNYATHVAETGREQKASRDLQRWADTLIADGQPMVRPRETERFDYEGELAVVIGKGGRRIARADAWPISRAYRSSTMARPAIGSATTSSSRRARTGPPPAPLARRWSCPMRSRILPASACRRASTANWCRISRSAT